MTQETKSAERRGPTTATKIKIAVVTIIGILVLIVIAQNTEQVTTRLLFAQVSMPRALLLVVMLAIGFAAGVLVTGAAYRRRTK